MALWNRQGDGKGPYRPPKKKYCDLEILAWRTLPPFHNWLRRLIYFSRDWIRRKVFEFSKISNLFSGTYANIESPPTRQQQHDRWSMTQLDNHSNDHDGKRQRPPLPSTPWRRWNATTTNRRYQPSHVAERWMNTSISTSICHHIVINHQAMNATEDRIGSRRPLINHQCTKKSHRT